MKRLHRQRVKAYNHSKKEGLVHLIPVGPNTQSSGSNEMPFCWDLYERELANYGIRLDTFSEDLHYMRLKKRKEYKWQMDEFIRHEFGESFLRERREASNCLCVQQDSITLYEHQLEGLLAEMEFDSINVGTELFRILKLPKFANPAFAPDLIGYIDVEFTIEKSGDITNPNVLVSSKYEEALSSHQQSEIVSYIYQILAERSPTSGVQYCGTAIRVRRELRLLLMNRKD